MTIIHGNQACVTHFFTFLLQAYKKALPVYLPVYLIPALIVHRQGLLKSALHNFVEGSVWYCKVKLVPLYVLFICLT
ncbi:hypothetical protein OROGR_021227 [Orobanche gracilis]